MGKQIIISLLCLMFTAQISASNNNLEEKINSLNEASMESIGISLNALAYLANASSDSYMPLWYLEKNGDMAYIQELEEAGYIKVNILGGLPDGKMSGEKQVNIVPLQLGREVKRYMLELKHNE